MGNAASLWPPVLDCGCPVEDGENGLRLTVTGPNGLRGRCLCSPKVSLT